MAEDPEEVLPQQRVRTHLRIEEVGTEVAVEHQQEQRNRDDGHGEEQQELHHEDHPGEHRHLEQGHARCTHIEHRDDQVHGGDQRRYAGDLEADGVEVHAVARRERHARVG